MNFYYFLVCANTLVLISQRFCCERRCARMCKSERNGGCDFEMNQNSARRGIHVTAAMIPNNENKIAKPNGWDGGAQKKKKKPLEKSAADHDHVGTLTPRHTTTHRVSHRAHIQTHTERHAPFRCDCVRTHIKTANVLRSPRIAHTITLGFNWSKWRYEMKT